MIGFMGAHRTGKTTLARQVAEKMGCEFVETKTSGVFEELGLNPRDAYPFRQRLLIQNKILERLAQQYRSADRTFVADRTPLDVLMYSWSEIHRDTEMNQADHQAFKAHIHSAYEITNRHFNLIFHVRPGICIVDAPGKAPPNPAYIHHLDMLCPSVANHPMLNSSVMGLPADVTDLDLRVQIVLSHALCSMSLSQRAAH